MFVRKCKGRPFPKTCGFEESLIPDLPELLQAFERARPQRRDLARKGRRRMKTEFRTESDSMGPMQVPVDAYFGAQTARAVENFPISGLRFHRSFIRALGLIKKHAAITNAALGLLPQDIAGTIQQAAQAAGDGKWDEQFGVAGFQTGSG